MKKLCVLLAVVGCLIGVASANAVDWTFTAKVTKTQAATAVDMAGWTAYLVGVSDWDTSDTTASLGKAVTSADVAKLSGDWGTSTYTVTTGTKSLTVSDAAGASMTYQMILSDGSKYLDAGTVTGTVYDPTDPSSVGTAMTKTLQGSTGYPQASALKSMTGGGDVPEPTSGLLLLVGGAMLALRRKQK